MAEEGTDGGTVELARKLPLCGGVGSLATGGMGGAAMVVAP